MRNSNQKKVASGKKRYVLAFVLRFLHNIFVLIILHHFTSSHFLHLCFFHSFHGVMIFHKFLTRVLLTPGPGPVELHKFSKTIIHDPVQLMISWGFKYLKWWFNVIYGNLPLFIYRTFWCGFPVFNLLSWKKATSSFCRLLQKENIHASHAL